MSSARRRGFVSLCLCLLVSLALHARAQVAPVLAASTAATVANAEGVAAATNGFAGWEPEDWLDPRTKTTSVLTRACGVLVEASITVTAEAAQLNLVLLNQAREALAFEPSATLVQLDHGLKRRVKARAGDLMIQPGWQRWLSLPLPSKSELRGRSSLGVELMVKSPSFGACRLQTRIERPPGPEREETFRRFSNLELSFGGGPRLLTTGSLHELTPKVGVAFGLDVVAFLSLRHGVALDLALETLGRRAAAKVAPDNSFNGKGNVEAAGFFLGYLYRLYPVGRLSVAYSPELGVIPFQLTDGSQNDNVRATSAVICPRQRLRVTLPVAPFLDGSFTLGLSVSHTYVPYGRLGEAQLSGNLLSAVLLLGIAG